MKEESEDMKIEETFRVNMKILRPQQDVFMKEESEDMRLKKHSESNMKILRTQTKMCLLKRRVKT